MDNEALSVAVEALKVIYDPTVSSEARQAAQQFCDNLKMRKDAPMLGYILAHKNNGYNDLVRHFGLTLLEESVRFRWDDRTYSFDERLAIRERIIDLLKSTNDILVEKKFIKEKVVKIFVEVAKREWPAKWDNMDQLLQDLYMENLTIRELVLMISRSLAEDIFIYMDEIDRTQRKDLQAALICLVASSTALEAQYPEGLKFFGKDSANLMRGEPGNLGWLARWTNGVKQHAMTWEQQQDYTSEMLAVATLNTIAAHLDWIISKSIADVNLLPVIANLLLSSSFAIRMAAVECILVLFSRNFAHIEDRSIAIWPMLDEGGLDVIYEAYKNVQSRDSNCVEEGEYNFAKNLVQAVVSLGVNQICFKKNISLIPKEFRKYIELTFVIISTHSSILIKSMILELWFAILKHDFVKRDSLALEMANSLLEIGSAQFQKLQHTEAYADYSLLDFDSPSEARAFVSKVQTRMLDVIKLAAQAKPREAYAWICSHSQIELMHYVNASDVDVIFRQNAIERNFLIMDAVVTELLPYLEDSKESFVSEGQLQKWLDSLLTFVIELPINDLFVLRHQLISIVNFATLFKYSSGSLTRILEKIFSLLSTGATNEQKLVLDNETRLRAASALVKLSTAIPEVLVCHFDEISNTVADLVNKDLVSSGEKVHLLDFLITISQNFADGSHRKAVIASFIGPLVSEWTSSVTTSVLASIETLMEYIGISTLRLYSMQISSLNVDVTLTQTLSQNMENNRRMRRKLLWPVNTLFVILKRILENQASSEQTIFWHPYIQHITPNLLTLIRLLHGLWSQAIIESLPKELHIIYEMIAQEKPQMAESNLARTLNEELISMRNWLEVAREQSYNLLGCLMQLGNNFFALPDILQSLKLSLFEQAQSIANRHWRILLNMVMKPFMLHCPPQSGLEDILASFFSYLNNKVVTEWERLVNNGLQLSVAEDENELMIDQESDISSEITEERVLRELTRTYVHLLLSIFQSNDEKDEDINLGRRTQMQKYLLANMSIARPMFVGLAYLVKVKDSISCQRSVLVCSKMLPLAIQLEPLREFLGHDLLRASLEALHETHHQPDQAAIIGLITELYVELRAFSTAPFEMFALLPGFDPIKLSQFESSLISETRPKVMRALVRQFLSNIVGVAQAQLFKRKETYIPSISTKTFAQSFTKRDKDILDQDEEEAGIAELFS